MRPKQYRPLSDLLGVGTRRGRHDSACVQVVPLLLLHCDPPKSAALPCIEKNINSSDLDEFGYRRDDMSIFASERKRNILIKLVLHVHQYGLARKKSLLIW